MKNIVFCDEVASGAIAGPVITCAVLNPAKKPIKKLKDSKQYSQAKREELFEILSPNLTYAFGAADVETIEKLNIHHAKYLAFKRAVDKLLSRGLKIDGVIVDGSFRISDLTVPQKAIVKADEKFWACSAASILAKVKRDRTMAKLGEIFEDYNWASNKGYYCPAHLFGIIRSGLTSLHRANFKYTKYSAWEREIYLNSDIDVNEYIEMVKTYKKINNISRYGMWLKTQEEEKTIGEVKW